MCGDKIEKNCWDTPRTTWIESGSVQLCHAYACLNITHHMLRRFHTMKKSNIRFRLRVFFDAARIFIHSIRIVWFNFIRLHITKTVIKTLQIQFKQNLPVQFFRDSNNKSSVGSIKQTPVKSSRRGVNQKLILCH